MVFYPYYDANLTSQLVAIDVSLMNIDNFSLMTLDFFPGKLYLPSCGSFIMLNIVQIYDNYPSILQWDSFGALFRAISEWCLSVNNSSA